MGHSIITRNARLKGDAGAVDPVLKHTVTSVTASSVDDLEQLVSIHSFDDRTKSLSKIICQVYKLNLAGVDEGESEKAEAGGSGRRVSQSGDHSLVTRKPGDTPDPSKVLERAEDQPGREGRRGIIDDC